MQVYSGVLETMTPLKGIINVDFFSKLDKVRSAANKKDFNDAVDILYEFDTKSSQTVMFTKEEEIIYSSFFNLGYGKSFEYELNICDLYSSEIQSLSITDDIKDRVLNIIYSYRDLIVFQEKVLNSTPEEELGTKSKKWDCPYKSCFDCCYTAKMQAIKDGNWIEIAMFVASFYISVPGYAAACLWDCAGQINE